MCLLFLYHSDQLILLIFGFSKFRFLLHHLEVFYDEKFQKQTRIFIVEMHHFFYECISKFCEYNIDKKFKVKFLRAIPSRKILWKCNHFFTNASINFVNTWLVKCSKLNSWERTQVEGGMVKVLSSALCFKQLKFSEFQ